MKGTTIPAARPKENNSMVFAVQCPNPKCRKYQLVEEQDRNKVVNCLLCKTAIRIGGGPANPGASPPAGNPPPKPKP